MSRRLPPPAEHRDSSLPAAASRGQTFTIQQDGYYGEEVELRHVWATLSRRRRSVFGVLALFVAAAAVWTWLQVPVWRASTLIRVDESQASSVPILDVLASIQQGSEIETEMRIIRTRPIAEEVVDELDLNLIVTDPRDVHREVFFQELQLDRATPEVEYRIRAGTDGTYVLEAHSDDFPTTSTPVRAGERVEIPGGSFVLADLAALREADGDELPAEIEFKTVGFGDAVEDLSETLEVSRPDREANVVQVAYEGTDRILVRNVPNVVARSFIAQRNEVQKTEVRSTVGFLQEQSDQLRSQLEAAEEELRSFREGRQIVALGAEAEAQVQRLAELQTQRSQLDAERAALSNLLESIEEAADPNYRRLAAFPTFLTNDAIADLLQELISADRARTELLVRVTPKHPDLIGVDNRIADLEAQLGSIGRNYLYSLTDQIASLDAVLARFGSELEEIPEKEVQFARLERQTTMLAELYTLLQTRLKEAEVAEAVEDPTVRVVETAILPLEPVSPRPLRNLALAAILGLMAGVGLAFGREYMDTRLHGSDSTEALFGLPTIGRIPSLSGVNGKRGTAALVTLEAGRSVGAEAFRTLRTNVRFVRGGEGANEIVVTSAGPQEGKSTTAANLAVALAQQGLRTVLVDGDLRRSVQHRQFGVRAEPGLTQVLVGDTELEGAIVPSGVEGLDILPSGAHPPNPAELLGGPRMDELLGRLRARYDSIVIDTPPTLAVTDASLLAPKAQGAVLVARAEQTDLEAVNLAVTQLRHVGAEILGMVVNDAKADAYSYYRKYYGDSEREGLRRLLPRS